MHHSQAEEAKPTWLRLALLRKRWGISRTTLFSVQRKHVELQSEYPFGPGLPVVRLSAVEAFERRKHVTSEARTGEHATDTAQARCNAQTEGAAEAYGAATQAPGGLMQRQPQCLVPLVPLGKDPRASS